MPPDGAWADRCSRQRSWVIRASTGARGARVSHLARRLPRSQNRPCGCLRPQGLCHRIQCDCRQRITPSHDTAPGGLACRGRLLVPGNWSRAEVEATVADYREMLVLELRDEPYNKAEHNRNLRRVLNGRSHGSVERKHQNISAILIEQECQYIPGYKPLGNYQDLLFDVVEAQVAGDHLLLALFKRDAETAASQPIIPASFEDFLAALEDPPNPRRRTPYLDRGRERRRTPPRVNYLALEASNAGQGRDGEKWVLQFERARLLQAGKESLADRIEWVSDTVGDHLGFDIRSFEKDGSDRLVEVKTTKQGKETPFYVTRNEVRISREHQRAYHLYRLFRFQKGPRLFTLPGALDRTCVLDPTEYEARVG